MITIQVLKEAVMEIISTIPEINTVKLVSNDDRFIDKLEKHQKADDAMLVVVIPAYKGFWNDENDNGGFVSYFQFFILNKIDYKTQEPEEEQEKLQPVMQDFLGKFFEYSKNDCKVFANLERNSVDIMAITNKGQCAGWEVQFNDETYTGYDGRFGE